MKQILLFSVIFIITFLGGIFFTLLAALEADRLASLLNIESAGAVYISVPGVMLGSLFLCIVLAKLEGWV